MGDVKANLMEANRILKHGVYLFMGFIYQTSSLGQHYLVKEAENVLYCKAAFFLASEVEKLLLDTGVVDQVWGQPCQNHWARSTKSSPFARDGGRAHLWGSRRLDHNNRANIYISPIKPDEEKCRLSKWELL